MAQYILAIALLADATPQSLPMKPKWTVDYAADRCVLSRARSGAEGGLRIDSRPYETYHDLTFLLPKVGAKRTLAKGRLSVRNHRPPDNDYIFVEEQKTVADRTAVTTITDRQLAQAAQDGSLGVVIPGKLDERVAVPGLAKALVALEACEQNLAAKWGVPRTWATDSEPNRDPRSVFTADDYPVSMLQAGQRGLSRLLLKVDAAGQVEGCRAIETVGSRVFAETTCSVIKARVKFTPARDSTGKAITSYYLAPSVRYQLEDW